MITDSFIQHAAQAPALRVTGTESKNKHPTSNVELWFAFGAAILLKKRSEATTTFDVRCWALNVRSSSFSCSLFQFKL